MQALLSIKKAVIQLHDGLGCQTYILLSFRFLVYILGKILYFRPG